MAATEQKQPLDGSSRPQLPSDPIITSTITTTMTAAAFLATAPLPSLLTTMYISFGELMTLGSLSRALYDSYGKRHGGNAQAHEYLVLRHPDLPSQPPSDDNDPHLASLGRLLQRYPTYNKAVKIVAPNALPYFARALHTPGCCTGLRAVSIEPSAEGDLDAFVEAGLSEDASADLRDFGSCELDSLVETIREKPQVFEGLKVLELHARLWKKDSLKQLTKALQDGSCPALANLSLQSLAKDDSKLFKLIGQTEHELALLVEGLTKRCMNACRSLQTLRIVSLSLPENEAFRTMLLSPICAELESLHFDSFCSTASSTTVAQWIEKTGAAKLQSLHYQATYFLVTEAPYHDNLMQELSKAGVAPRLRHLQLVGTTTNWQGWNAFEEAIVTGRFPCLETLSLGMMPEKQIATLMEAFKNNRKASATLIELSFTRLSMWLELSGELEIVLLTLQGGLFPNLRKLSFFRFPPRNDARAARCKEIKAALEKQREGKLQILFEV